MKIVTKPEEMQLLASQLRKDGKTIGAVPTMGFFHEGHLSLMREARRRCDVVFISIFVNPAQFGEGEDFEDYPRDLDQDVRLAEQVGVDYIFHPTAEDMYPSGYSTFVEVEGLTKVLCGASRPTHFRGVTTIVAKLFNLLQPHQAFFGQKDAQQTIVIKRMVRDLNMDVEIVVMPTVREVDGLALSSRNEYLSPEERKEAISLCQALKKAEEMVASGEVRTGPIIDVMRGLINQGKYVNIDYISAVDINTLSEVEEVVGPTLIALAVWVGKTRLIDNIVLQA